MQIGKTKVWDTQGGTRGLRDLSFIWKKIAEILCVSERTLQTKRRELEITGKYAGIKNNELDNFIQEILYSKTVQT